MVDSSQNTEFKSYSISKDELVKTNKDMPTVDKSSSQETTILATTNLSITIGIKAKDVITIHISTSPSEQNPVDPVEETTSEKISVSSLNGKDTITDSTEKLLVRNIPSSGSISKAIQTNESWENQTSTDCITVQNFDCSGNDSRKTSSTKSNIDALGSKNPIQMVNTETSVHDLDVGNNSDDVNKSNIYISVNNFCKSTSLAKLCQDLIKTDKETDTHDLFKEYKIKNPPQLPKWMNRKPKFKNLSNKMKYLRYPSIPYIARRLLNPGQCDSNSSSCYSFTTDKNGYDNTSLLQSACNNNNNNNNNNSVQANSEKLATITGKHLYEEENENSLSLKTYKGHSIFSMFTPQNTQTLHSRNKEAILVKPFSRGNTEEFENVTEIFDNKQDAKLHDLVNSKIDLSHNPIRFYNIEKQLVTKYVLFYCYPESLRNNKQPSYIELCSHCFGNIENFVSDDTEQKPESEYSCSGSNILKENCPEQSKAIITEECKNIPLELITAMAAKHKNITPFENSIVEKEEKQTPFLLTQLNNFEVNTANPNLYEELEKILNDNFKAACEIVNWHFENPGMKEDNLKSSITTIEQSWFEVAGSKHSSIDTVRVFLKYLRYISPRLLSFVVNSAFRDGNSVLHFAVANNQFAIVDEILNTNCCNIDAPNKAGYTPLIVCAACHPKNEDDYNIIRKLFEKGNINFQSKQLAQTALMMAADLNNEIITQLLLQQNADINIRDADGSTALMYACEKGRLGIAKLLVRQTNCDVSIKDNDGHNAFDIAMKNNHSDIGVLFFIHKSKGKDKYGSKMKI